MVKERCKTKWQDKGSCTLMSVYFDHRLFRSNINRSIKMERNGAQNINRINYHFLNWTFYINIYTTIWILKLLLKNSFNFLVTNISWIWGSLNPTILYPHYCDNAFLHIIIKFRSLTYNFKLFCYPNLKKKGHIFLLLFCKCYCVSGSMI